MTDLLTLAARAHWNRRHIPDWELISDKEGPIGDMRSALLALADEIKRQRDIMDRALGEQEDKHLLTPWRKLYDTENYLREVAGQG